MSTAANKVYDDIRRAIIAGRFLPGTHLTEGFLARWLKVSRTPIREVLRRLDAHGFVRFIPNQGAFVASQSHSDVADTYTLRAVLEAQAAELAATNLSAAQLNELRELQTTMEQAVTGGAEDRLDRVAAANDRFHRLIAQASRNARLADLLANLIDLLMAWSTFSHYTPEDLSRSMAHHRELLSAFDARDSTWAGAVMRAHVLAARASVASAINLMEHQGATLHSSPASNAEEKPAPMSRRAKRRIGKNASGENRI